MASAATRPTLTADAPLALRDFRSLDNELNLPVIGSEGDVERVIF